MIADERATETMAQAVARRDRIVVLAGLGAVIALAAAYTVYLAGQMAHPAVTLAWVRRPLAGAGTFGGGRAYLMLVGMWVVMQVAMMSPTAVPVVLLHARIVRQRQPQRAPFGSTALFYAGYVAVWAAFSATLAAVQVGLQAAALLTPALASASPLLGGGILIAAGAFQFSALKRACLNQCRSPIGFLMAEWRSGPVGAWVMGAKHGLHCVGCCWALMALLFVAGVMNLLWMAIITSFLLVEKVAPAGDRVGRAAGAFFIVWGVWMIAPALPS